MNAGEVSQSIYKHFINYDYKLFCTFMFGGWESDFFAQSGSGYFIEVEVKVSRGDYFVDFKKDKHEIFKALHAKKEILVRRNSFYNRDGVGDIVVRNFRAPRFQFAGRMSNYKTQIKNGSEELVEYSYTSRGHDKSQFKQHQFIVNDWDFRRINIDYEYAKHIRYAATSVEYINLVERNYPNQFWYAVPEGLVKLEEVPLYAGLIYCLEDGGTKVIRKAPFLHKRKMNLTSALLKKYYNLWQYHVDYKTKLQILTENKETQ